MSMLPEKKTNSKICNTCKELKPLEDFNLRTASPDGRQSMCKACYSVYTKHHYHTDPSRKFLSGMQVRSRKRGWEEVEWTVEEIREKMQGCCEVTGIPFDQERSTSDRHMGSPFVASPDRIDNSKGYTKENTRWVVWIFNLMCGNFTDEQVKEFIEHLRNNEVNL
jgi:hypothetical protein